MCVFASAHELAETYGGGGELLGRNMGTRMKIVQGRGVSWGIVGGRGMSIMK